MALEIEVKFYLENPDALRERILSRGGVSLGKFPEYNIRFEDRDDSLIRNSALLRLRQDAKARLTFKSSPGRDSDPNMPDGGKGREGEFKIREELEVEVSDFDEMKKILERLGYHSRQVYEKRRETFRLGAVILCLDEMPMGDFLEIEGEKEPIRETAELLELDWNRRILSNYLRIFSHLRLQHRLSFSDLTFAHFSGTDADFGPDIRFFEAGNAGLSLTE